jgi:hypothetical protein
MAGIVLSSPNVQEVFDLARKYVWTARCANQRTVTAPRHRSREYAGGIVRLLGEGRKIAPATTGAEWLGRRSSNCAASSRMAIDIDPQSFY